MLAVVKKPHTKQALLEINGEIPAWLVDDLKSEYGSYLQLSDTGKGSRCINVPATDWYRATSPEVTPSDTLKICRENLDLTQAELGRKLGDFSRQNISAMENGRRGISKTVAKKLSEIFSVPADRFL